MQIQPLLESVEKKGASDLLLVAGSAPTLRISTRLEKTANPSLTHESVKELVYQMLTPEEIGRFEKEKELDIGYQIGKSRFRVNIHYERGNVACSVRRISLSIPTLEELHVPRIVGTFCGLPRGLILVTGPTGSGKSTTQAAMLDIVNNNRACHIITIEDPIEYLHTNKKALIEQREVGEDTLSFPNALKRVLRQDPDVILVGEMRDLETIQTAITAAETGHLVISTLHTNDAAQAVDRMIDVFPPHQQPQVRIQLSLTLQGIIAQQLLPKKDGIGVVPAIEVLLVNAAVRNIIRKATTQEIYSVIETSAKAGMVGMDAALKELYKTGQISAEEAVARSRNVEDVALAVGLGSK